MAEQVSTDAAEDGRRILVVGPSWVGDMVMAQSLFMRLRQLYPHGTIDVLAPPWSQPLLERMPEVERGFPMPVGHGELGLGVRRRIGRELRSHRHHQAIVLPNSFKSALIPFWAGVPRRTGYRGEMRFGLLNDIRRLDKQALPKTVLRFLHLADEAGSAAPAAVPQPRLQLDPVQVSRARASFELEDHQSPILALCPGAEYGPAKRWPEQHFAALSRAMMARGWQVWLFGSEKDRVVADSIVSAAPGAINLAGRTQLAEAIDLMGAATAVVSNDSGLMHVAAALGRPLVALYGSSDPGFTPPLSTHHRIIDRGLDCSPCFKRVCPLEHLDCLNGIEPGSVVAALEDLIGTVDFAAGSAT